MTIWEVIKALYEDPTKRFAIAEDPQFAIGFDTKGRLCWIGDTTSNEVSFFNIWDKRMNKEALIDGSLVIDNVNVEWVELNKNSCIE